MPDKDPQSIGLYITIILGILSIFNGLLYIIYRGIIKRMDGFSTALPERVKELHERIDKVIADYVDHKLCKAHRSGIYKRKEDKED